MRCVEFHGFTVCQDSGSADQRNIVEMNHVKDIFGEYTRDGMPLQAGNGQLVCYQWGQKSCSALQRKR